MTEQTPHDPAASSPRAGAPTAGQAKSRRAPSNPSEAEPASRSRRAIWCAWIFGGWALWLGLACFAELGADPTKPDAAEDLAIALDLDRHAQLVDTTPRAP